MKRAAPRILLLVTVLGLLMTGCHDDDDAVLPTATPGSLPRILYINSYHEGYPPSDGLETGIHSVLDEAEVEWQIHRMNTKNNPAEAFKIAAAQQARDLIERYQPDLVIVSDDNAFAYLVRPYYRDADLPFVFVGVNWDISQYEGPYDNTTGMLEVALIPQIIEHLQPYATGDRVGYLAGDLMSERNTARFAQEMFELEFAETYFVTTFEEWQQVFLQAQDEVDLLIFENTAGIDGWDDDAGAAFVRQHIAIPVGATNDYMMPYAVLGIARDYPEQGVWAAQTALRILAGTAPSDIPVTYNERGRIYLNMRLAAKLEIVFPVELVDHASLFDQ